MRTHKSGLLLIGIFILGSFIGIFWMQKKAVNHPVRSAIQPAPLHLRNQESIATNTASAQAPLSPAKKSQISQKDAIPGEVVLLFSDQNARERFLAMLSQKGRKPIGVLDALNAVRVRSSDIEGMDMEGIRQDFNYLVLTPDEPEIRGSDGIAYRAFAGDALAWLGADPSQGARGIMIAVLDTGVDRGSVIGQRLAGQVEIYPVAGDGTESSGHGSAVVALLTGDGGAITGITPDASVWSFRVLSNEGVGDSFTLAQGITEAVNRGARVIVMSLGSMQNSTVLQEAVQYAQQRNVTIVAAAGNDYANQLAYPAAYDGVLSVGAVDANGTVPAFSNQSETLDVVAPGVGVSTRWNDTTIAPFSGTSAAVPFVAGAVAEVLSTSPQSTPAQVAGMIRQTSNDAGAPGIDTVYGSGVLNLQRLNESNQSGIYRLDITGHYLDTANVTENTIPVQIGVQNRGTEVLENVTLLAEANNQQWTTQPVRLLPGETLGMKINITSEGANQIRIQSHATSTTSGVNTPSAVSVLSQ